MKRYRTYAPHQSFLLPPSPLDWLPEGHLAYFVLEVAQTLDVSAVDSVRQAKDARGTQAYDTRMMIALLVYGYCIGLLSSRRIERATHEDVAFRVLAGGQHPHFTTISDFRLEHRAALASFFAQVLRLCARAGLVKLGHVSLDGTKILANASKHKAMSYKRMKEEEQRLGKEIDDLLAQADAVDRAEDDLYGVGQSPADLPEELRRREARLQRIREAKEALEQEAAAARAAELRENAEGQEEKSQSSTIDEAERKRAATRAKKARDEADRLSADDEDDAPPSGAGELPSHRVPCTADGEPKPEAQRNFTDPDSRIMVRDGAFVQAYNAQAAVDADSQVIVAEAVTNQAPDQEHFVPMLERVIENTGRAPEKATADNGYFSRANVEHCEQRGVDAYISVGRKRPVSTAAPTARAETARERMAAKLSTDAGRTIYARRKCVPEPVFGQIKTVQGFRRFSLRGVQKARSEWSLVCACHNLRKLYRAVAGSLRNLGALSPAPLPA